MTNPAGTETVAPGAFDIAETQKMFREIIEFAKGARVETGFGYLNSDGVPDPQKPAELWINCRMTHMFSLASMLGIDGAAELAEHGIKCISNYFKDPEHGGWYSAIATQTDADGNAVAVLDKKEAYAHAFVLLAATSAVAANIPGGDRLYVEARENQDEHWWKANEQRVVEAYDRTFTEVEDYRGVNSNMHTVEAYISAYDVTNDRELLDRAVSILEFISSLGSSTNWRLPEHFNSRWFPQPAYNAEKPADPFRPFGATPGHGMEWSRLTLHARASLLAADGTAPEWMLPAAYGLYTRAAADGWFVDGAPGFVYTTAMDGLPVVRERMHWVIFEAMDAGIVMLATIESEAELPESLTSGFFADGIRDQLKEWWEYSKQYLLASPGRWSHELSAKNQPSTRTWAGHPDAYHVGQMLLLPQIGAGPTFAAAVREGLVK